MDIRLRSLVLVLLCMALVALLGCSAQPAADLGASDSSVGASAEAPEPSVVPTPVPTSGILAIGFGDDGGWRTYIRLTLIDVETGVSLIWREFRPAGGAVPAVTDDATPLLARRLFTPNYDRIAAEVKGASDGSRHVGWITSDGAYVDVTDAITSAQSDFSDAVRHTEPKFGSDGMFYFLDMNAGEIKKVDPENLSPSAVKKVADSPGEGYFLLYPSGTVQGYSWGQGDNSRLVEGAAPGVFGRGRVEDWLDSKTLLTADGDGRGASVHMVYSSIAFTKESQGDEFGGRGTDIGVKELVPTTSSRLSWNPVSSPDGKQVAFLSATGKEVAPELFTVARNGGDPVKIATDYQFGCVIARDYRLQLLAWLP